MKDKVIQTIGGILFFVGFFLLIGWVGSNDYASECGVYRSLFEDWQLVVAGIAMMIVSAFLLKDFNND